MMKYGKCTVDGCSYGPDKKWPGHCNRTGRSSSRGEGRAKPNLKRKETKDAMESHEQSHDHNQDIHLGTVVAPLTPVGKKEQEEESRNHVPHMSL